MAALEMKVQAKEDEKVTELVESDTKITEEKIEKSLKSMTGSASVEGKHPRS